jgi:hypothetical protein
VRAVHVFECGEATCAGYATLKEITGYGEGLTVKDYRSEVETNAEEGVVSLSLQQSVREQANTGDHVATGIGFRGATLALNAFSKLATKSSLSHEEDSTRGGFCHLDVKGFAKESVAVAVAAAMAMAVAVTAAVAVTVSVPVAVRSCGCGCGCGNGCGCGCDCGRGCDCVCACCRS